MDLEQELLDLENEFKNNEGTTTNEQEEANTVMTEADHMLIYEKMVEDLKDVAEEKKKHFLRLLQPGHKYLNLNPFAVRNFEFFVLEY